MTVVTSDPDREDRARRAIEHMERTIPVLVAQGVTDIAGRNLYTPALYRRGLTAASVFGRRVIELAPGLPARQPPTQVARAAGAARDVVWNA